VPTIPPGTLRHGQALAPSAHLQMNDDTADTIGSWTSIMGIWQIPPAHAGRRAILHPSRIGAPHKPVRYVDPTGIRGCPMSREDLPPCQHSRIACPIPRAVRVLTSILAGVGIGSPHYT
jgi:hypothetical protein